MRKTQWHAFFLQDAESAAIEERPAKLVSLAVAHCRIVFGKSLTPFRRRPAAQYVKLVSQYAPDNAIFLNTAPSGAHGVHWSYFAFSNREIRGRDLNTIKRWYEIEMKKISSTDQLQSLLDDPDATNH